VIHQVLDIEVFSLFVVDSLSPQKSIFGRRPPPEPPQHVNSDSMDDNDDDDDYVEKTEFEKIQQQIGVKRSTSDISPSSLTRASGNIHCFVSSVYESLLNHLSE